MLLHGGGTDRASLSWGPLIGPLSATRRVIAPDFPGYGGSAPLAGAGVPVLVDWLAAFLDTLGIERASLAGLSMGGAVALASALARPERVDAVVAIDSYGLQPRVAWHPLAWLAQRATRPMARLMAGRRWFARRALRAIFADPSRIDDALVDEFLEALAASDHMAAFAAFQRAEVGPLRLATDLRPRLPAIGCPVTFVHGRMDTLVPLRYAREAAAMTPGARLVVVEAGHWPTREVPADVLKSLGDALP